MTKRDHSLLFNPTKYFLTSVLSASSKVTATLRWNVTKKDCSWVSVTLFLGAIFGVLHQNLNSCKKSECAVSGMETRLPNKF